MTNQMSSMNAWDKEEMDGNILDEGNAMSQIRHPTLYNIAKESNKRSSRGLFQDHEFCIQSCDQENCLMLFIRKTVISTLNARSRPTPSYAYEDIL